MARDKARSQAPGSSETSVLTTSTRRNIPEDTILHSHRRENLKSYIAVIRSLLIGTLDHFVCPVVHILVLQRRILTHIYEIALSTCLKKTFKSALLIWMKCTTGNYALLNCAKIIFYKFWIEFHVRSSFLIFLCAKRRKKNDKIVFICAFEGLGSAINLVLSSSKWIEQSRPVHIHSRIRHSYSEVVKNPPQASFIHSFVSDPFGYASLCRWKPRMNSCSYYLCTFIYITCSTLKVTSRNRSLW
jgi:hypothetical protein